jgi:isoaspartyl peptidase/L-asparaginase-like protein (Ntn-hydrolase superfamily)
MVSRRNFLITGTLATGGFLAIPREILSEKALSPLVNPDLPLIISTWDFGRKANVRAAEILKSGGIATEAVEKGINLIEADPENTSVGIGGLPDRDGFVTLDACIMDSQGRAGSVTFLQQIVHPISVARKVMEETPHVMLSGSGALQFALECGFRKENLLTESSRKAWEEWKKTSEYKPVINIENHDTIGMLVMDAEGDISGGCSTSGLAYKMHGRVGDSPIIGAGLFVDNEVGAAVATGLGEMVMKTLGAFLVVELMRHGKSPQEACEEAILRVVKNNKNHQEFQVGIIALNKDGITGAYAIQPGFTYAFSQGDNHTVLSASSYL